MSLTRLSLLVLALALAACGGGKSMQARTAAPETAGTSPLPPDSHTQIKQLEAEIETTRSEMQLAEPAAVPSPRPATPFYQAPETDPNCKPAKTETCSKSCKLSGSICKNAQKICDLAQELPNDNWATQKCARANTICEAAHAKCCGCQ